MTVLECFEEFIEYKCTYLRPRSIDNYRAIIAPFIDYIGPYKEISAIDNKTVQKWLISINTANLSTASKATKIRNVKIFLKWVSLEYDSYINSEFKVDKIKLPKVYKKEIHILTDYEVQMLFDSVTVNVDWLTFRNKLIIALMYDSGLRQSETTLLLRNKINLHDKTIIVLGKGGKERIVPIGLMTFKFLKLYLKTCPFASQYLILNKHGQPLTCNAVKLMISKLNNKLPFHVYSHMLRHNFATNFLLNQLTDYGFTDAYSLMAIMGHEDIQTTQLYEHIAKRIWSTHSYKSHLDSINISI